MACQLDYLCGLPTDKARREGLETLPPTLEQTYNRILEGINSSSKDRFQKMEYDFKLNFYCRNFYIPELV